MCLGTFFAQKHHAGLVLITGSGIFTAWHVLSVCVVVKYLNLVLQTAQLSSATHGHRSLCPDKQRCSVPRLYIVVPWFVWFACVTGSFAVTGVLTSKGLLGTNEFDETGVPCRCRGIAGGKDVEMDWLLLVAMTMIFKYAVYQPVVLLLATCLHLHAANKLAGVGGGGGRDQILPITVGNPMRRGSRGRGSSSGDGSCGGSGRGSDSSGGGGGETKGEGTDSKVGGEAGKLTRIKARDSWGTSSESFSRSSQEDVDDSSDDDSDDSSDNGSRSSVATLSGSSGESDEGSNVESDDARSSTETPGVRISLRKKLSKRAYIAQITVRLVLHYYSSTSTMNCFLMSWWCDL